MKFILVRHGETTANTNSVILGGKEGGTLSDRGNRQAKALGERLAAERLSEVYCSPANRARQTCEAMLKGREIRPTFKEELREIEMGDLVGLSHEEAEKRFPNIFEDIFAHPDKPIPGGESLADVSTRVIPLLESLAQNDGNPTILAVGHNVVNRVILSYLLSMPLEKAKNIKQKNCSISVLDVKPGFARLYTLDNSIHVMR
ncbi:MAG: histidine phosphatase family protein [Candidatus Altiarchaeota archaeon]